MWHVCMASSKQSNLISLCDSFIDANGSLVFGRGVIICFLFWARNFTQMLKFAGGIIHREKIRWNTSRFEITTSSSILIQFFLFGRRIRNEQLYICAFSLSSSIILHSEYYRNSYFCILFMISLHPVSAMAGT